jgi:hypothetical protein
MAVYCDNHIVEKSYHRFFNMSFSVIFGNLNVFDLNFFLSWLILLSMKKLIDILKLFLIKPIWTIPVFR